MRVGVVEVDIARLGGRQRTMLAFAACLTAQGHDVRVFSAPPGSCSNASSEEVVRLAAGLAHTNFVWGNPTAITPKQTADLDVLLVSLPYLGHLQAQVGKPVICWAIHPDQRPVADTVFWTNSYTTLRRLQARPYWRGQSIDVVIPPHDYQLFREAQKAWHARKYDVVTVGGLLRAKGLVEFDRLCASLDLKSLIVGARRRAFLRESEEVLAQLTHSDIVVDAPRREVAQLLGDARVYLCLSYAESCPLVIYEALNAGCNVVSRAVGAVEEQVGGYGRVFTAEAYAALDVERALLAPDGGVSRGFMFDQQQVAGWVAVALVRACQKAVLPKRAVSVVHRYPESAYVAHQRTATELISVLVKTFDRPHCLARLLKSIRVTYPQLQVHVVDDGALSAEEVCMRDPYVTYERLSFDVGVGVSRNQALMQIQTPYVLKVDDDFVFSRSTDLIGAYERLRWHEFDLLAGATLWEQAGHGQTARRPDGLLLRRYYGLMQLEGRNVVLRPGLCGVRGDCLQVDMAPDFFLAPTDVLLRHKWDPDIKICGAHMDFFWRAKQAGLCIGYWEGLKVLHLSHRTPDYNKFRKRLSFLALAAQKNGLDAFVDPGFGSWYSIGTPLHVEAPWVH